MTKQEREKLTAASKRAAEEDLHNRLASLDYYETANTEAWMNNSFFHQRDDLDGIARLARQNKLECPFIIRRQELTTLLTLPHVLIWQEWTDETEEDPVSGNPRQKVITRRAPVKENAAAADVRHAFVAALLAVVAMARRIGSGTYADLRAVYLRVNETALRQGDYVRFDADWTEGILDDLERLLPDLKADVDIYKEDKAAEGEVTHE